MRTLHLLPLLAPALLWAATLAPAPPDAVGSPLPAVALEGFTQTKAASLEDYSGRALLIEFFAYW